MKKILVVNNDNDTMSLLKIWLEKKAYDVKFTGNHDEVYEIMNDFKPELVIVDVLQKEIAEDLKMNQNTHTIPVLLMTGYTLRQKSNESLVDDVIEKPFNLPLLKKKIERLIEKSNMLNETGS